MKNLRLTLIGKENFLFRILFRGKKLDSPIPDMLHGVKQKKKDFYAIFRCSEDFLYHFYAIFCLIFI